MSLIIVEVDGTADGCSDGKSDKLDDWQTLCSKHMLSKPNLSEPVEKSILRMMAAMLDNNGSQAVLGDGDALGKVESSER